MTSCRKVKFISATLPAFLLLISGSGCEKANSAADKKPAAPVKVEVAVPLEQEVTDFQDFIGRDSCSRQRLSDEDCV